MVLVGGDSRYPRDDGHAQAGDRVAARTGGTRRSPMGREPLLAPPEWDARENMFRCEMRLGPRATRTVDAGDVAQLLRPRMRSGTAATGRFSSTRPGAHFPARTSSSHARALGVPVGSKAHKTLSAHQTAWLHRSASADGRRGQDPGGDRSTSSRGAAAGSIAPALNGGEARMGRAGLLVPGAGARSFRAAGASRLRRKLGALPGLRRQGSHPARHRRARHRPLGVRGGGYTTRVRRTGRDG